MNKIWSNTMIESQMLESPIYSLTCPSYSIGEEVELKEYNVTMFRSNIVEVPVLEDRIKIINLEDGKVIYVESVYKLSSKPGIVVLNYVIVEDNDKAIVQFKCNADVKDKLKYVSIYHRFYESYTRNVALSLTYKYKTYYATVFYCDKDDIFKLKDKVTSEIYLSPGEFRDAYVLPDRRNGQQISNMHVLLDNSCFGVYALYRPFQSLYGKVIAENEAITSDSEDDITSDTE